MSTGSQPPSWPPGQPPGWPPERPRPSEGEPGRARPEGLGAWLGERLFERRVVVVRGRLDQESATSVSAQVLTLDAMGDGPVHLRVDSPDGDLGAVLLLMDSLDLLGAKSHVTVTGEVGGASLGLLTAAGRRDAYPHARVRMAEPRVDIAGTAGQLLSETSQHLQMLDALIVRMAESTGRPRHEVESDMGAGRFLTAAEAVEYGLLDEVVGPRAAE